MQSKMLVLIQLIAIVLAFISQQHVALASLVVPVTKHTDAAVNPLYSAHAYLDKAQYPSPLISTPAYWNEWRYVQQSLLIDLDAPFSWHYSFPRQEGCQECRQTVTCTESPCTDLRTTSSYQSPLCPPPTNTSMYDIYMDCETCPVNVISPVTGECSQVIPTYEQFMFTRSNGGAVYSYDPHITYPIAGSTPPWTFDPFPSDVLGVMALSSSPYALPAYLGEVDRVIALCLPSNVSAGPGVLLFGYGPYYLGPQRDVDVRSLLSYTELLKHPNTFGYFIGVNAIVIKKQSIMVPVNATTKISTLEPYTKLRTDIYNGVVRRVSKVTKRIPPAKSVAPFGLCFNTTVNGTTVGIKVPDIDLALQDGKKWTISTANSIKQVTEDVACLAVVDNGPTSEHAIVIGTHQFEDNLLVFDLMTSTLGFSSSLLRNHTSCSNFDFAVSH
ncbi:putative aspartic peptidase A1 family, aspartic peptidase domain superfamily, xylanase inhibitor [Helianthus annuus]|nr:putative aspartic peptidase A1 family, aspartic peptidase domain superfamily, xylanase inhibitor [Helianthus annuus]